MPEVRRYCCPLPWFAHNGSTFSPGEHFKLHFHYHTHFIILVLAPVMEKAEYTNLVQSYFSLQSKAPTEA